MMPMPSAKNQSPLTGATEHHWCNHAAFEQTGNQRVGLAVTVGKAHPSALTLGAEAGTAGHIGGSPRLVYKHEELRLQIELAVEPLPTPL